MLLKLSLSDHTLLLALLQIAQQTILETAATPGVHKPLVAYMTDYAGRAATLRDRIGAKL